jgi:hypothetical protein
MLFIKYINYFFIKLTKELEITFHSKIISTATSNSCKLNKPMEYFENYALSQSDDLTTVISHIIDNTKKILNVLNISNSLDKNYSSKVFQPIKKEKKLIRILDDINVHFEEMGLFGGNKSCLLHLIQLEYIKKFMDNQVLYTIVEYFIS